MVGRRSISLLRKLAYWQMCRNTPLEARAKHGGLKRIRIAEHDVWWDGVLRVKSLLGWTDFSYSSIPGGSHGTILCALNIEKF
jgi:hypothetical protein